VIGNDGGGKEKVQNSVAVMDIWLDWSRWDEKWPRSRTTETGRGSGRAGLLDSEKFAKVSRLWVLQGVAGN